MTTNVNCSTCGFFVRVNSEAGHCHANPPHPFLVPAPAGRIAVGNQPNFVVQGVWPPVGVNDWCARHVLATRPQPVNDRLAEGVEGSA